MTKFYMALNDLGINCLRPSRLRDSSHSIEIKCSVICRCKTSSGSFWARSDTARRSRWRLAPVLRNCNEQRIRSKRLAADGRRGRLLFFLESSSDALSSLYYWNVDLEPARCRAGRGNWFIACLVSLGPCKSYLLVCRDQRALSAL